MSSNILKRKNLLAIYLVYNDESKNQIMVNVHFADDDIYYLEADLSDENVKKPKHNMEADILAYTSNGVYIGKTKITDTTLTFKKVMFVVKAPRKWDLTQSRLSTRKEISLPFKIQYNDGYQIEAKCLNISSGGISFVLSEPIKQIYTRFVARIIIDVSGLNIKGIENEVIKSDIKYIRESFTDKSITYVYRFLAMDSHNLNVLKLLLNAI